jgi:hypothetical protein
MYKIDDHVDVTVKILIFWWFFPLMFISDLQSQDYGVCRK